MGSWSMTTRPMITMRMEMTIATMGRLMKNLAMGSDPARYFGWPRLGAAPPLPAGGGRGGRGGGNGLASRRHGLWIRGQGLDLLAGFHLVETFDDDPLARLQSLRDDPE